MHAQALAQLDRALLRGVALVVRQRLDRLDCQAAWETVKILGAVLDREAAVRDGVQAETLRNQLRKATAAEVDVDAAKGAIDTLFPCP